MLPKYARVGPGAPPLNTRLLEALVASSVVDRDDATRAREVAVHGEVFVEDALLRIKALDELALLKFSATHYGTHFVSPKRLLLAAPPARATELMPVDLARLHTIAPVKHEESTGHLTVASVIPDDPEMLAALTDAGISSVQAIVCTPDAVRAAISRLYGPDSLHGA